MKKSQKMRHFVCFAFLLLSIETFCQKQQLMLSVGHTRTVSKVLKNSTADLYASVAIDQYKIWDKTTKKLIRTIEDCIGTNSEFSKFAVDVEGQIAIVDLEGKVLWKINNDCKIQQMTIYDTIAISISPCIGKVFVWDLVKQKKIDSVNLKTNSYSDLQFDHKRNVAIVNGQDSVAIFRIGAASFARKYAGYGAVLNAKSVEVAIAESGTLMVLNNVKKA